MKTQVAARRRRRWRRRRRRPQSSRWETCPKLRRWQMVVDEWVAEKVYGFGKAQTGETIITRASSFLGGEADAWTQVVSDDARAIGYRS